MLVDPGVYQSTWRTSQLSIKGQLGVPLTVYPWYLLCSLGILGDYNPLYRAYIGISHDGVRWDRGTSNRPLNQQYQGLDVFQQLYGGATEIQGAEKSRRDGTSWL